MKTTFIQGYVIITALAFFYALTGWLVLIGHEEAKIAIGAAIGHAFAAIQWSIGSSRGSQMKTEAAISGGGYATQIPSLGTQVPNLGIAPAVGGMREPGQAG
jgi:hypothetical protein